MRAILLLAVALISCGAQEIKGRLFIVGGGKQPEAMVRRFIEMAGGRIVVFPMASDDGVGSGESQVKHFKAHGAGQVESIVLTREEAMKPESVKRLDGASAVYFTGGDQSKLAAVLVGTPIQKKLKEMYAAGALIGGTSAGAAIMSEVMITGEELLNKDKTNAFKFIRQKDIETIPGLGFMTNALIDQHFIKRKRLNRLFSAVLEHPTLIGIGIDESTAILVNLDGTFEVIGESTVMVIDARKAAKIRTDQNGSLAAREIKTHLLLAGDRFDMK